MSIFHYPIPLKYVRADGANDSSALRKIAESSSSPIRFHYIQSSANISRKCMYTPLLESPGYGLNNQFRRLIFLNVKPVNGEARTTQLMKRTWSL